MLVTSALGPALCCCVPFSLAPVSSVEAQTPAKPHLKLCPHCKNAASSQPDGSNPAGKCPCDPKSPGQKNCPCRDHHLTPVITDDSGIRLGVSAVWSLALPPLVVLPLERPLADPALTRTAHTGPPPLGGVELLHRLHILVC